MPWIKPPWARPLNWIWCKFHILWRSLVHQSHGGSCRPNYLYMSFNFTQLVGINEWILQSVTLDFAWKLKTALNFMTKLWRLLWMNVFLYVLAMNLAQAHDSVLKMNYYHHLNLIYIIRSQALSPLLTHSLPSQYKKKWVTLRNNTI